MREISMNNPMRVGLISLGCAKNLVDAEIMLGTLLKDGVEITNDPGEADVVIVNTCSFIDSEQQESVDAILESAQVREANNRGQGLVVSGCLPQRFRDELPKLLPEVDAFMGIDQVNQVTEIVRKALVIRRERPGNRGEKSGVRSQESGARSQEPRARSQKEKIVGRLAELDQNRGNGHEDHAARHTKHATRSVSSLPLLEVTSRPQYIPDYATPRFRLTPRHFAYVKISEGCNHPCSFCIIPQMRGSHRSRRQADVVQEARALIAAGVKELNLISQDSTYYGLDLRPNPSR